MTPWHTHRLGTRLAALGLLGALLGLGLAPAARAADVVVSSSYPTVIFHDTFFMKSKWLLQGPGLSSGSFYLYDSETQNIILQAESGAFNNHSLFVRSDGDVQLANLTLNVRRGTGSVGIGTEFPQGKLHIFGPEAEDTFSGIGPDLVTGPAFNFGYSGASFGRGSGFFNVRPDALAVAPNPSLRFATNNLQRMIITNTGNVGIGTTSPTNPLQMASGARVTAGGVWTDASSREVKQDIAPLSADTARAALEQLAPVTFAYRADPAEHHVGFVAEDVPALVATADRKGLSPMDIVAVLTRVVQEQQAAMARLEAEVAELRRAVGR
jgi:hypothetical protein